MNPENEKTSVSDWKWGGAVFAIGGLWLAVHYFSKGDLFGIVGVLTLVCGAGLWFQQEWAGWAASGMCLTMGAFYGTMRLLDHTFSIKTGVFLLGSIYGAWSIWNQCRKTSAPPATKRNEEEKKPLISLVLLLREARYLESRVLAEIVSSAWGEPYSSGESDKDSVRWVVGETPLFMIAAPEGMFIVNNFDRQYFENTSAVLDEIHELRLRKVLEDHHAWLSVDLISLNDESAPRESVYPRIAQLIAELGGPDCLALYQPESHKTSIWDESLESKLRGPDCTEAIGVQTNVPVIQVGADDPRMKAAVDEARKRWPEFVEAFKKRDGEHFSIKAPITANDRTEFIWIDVEGLEPEYIHGVLGNDPVDLGELKLGSRVEVPLQDLNDWVFIRNGEPVGMFTVNVIAEIEKQRKS